MFINKLNIVYAEKFFKKIIKIGSEFKIKNKVFEKVAKLREQKKIITSFPEKGKSLGEVVDEFKKDILPFCSNFSSRGFMGFPDAGNSLAGISGALFEVFLQQNLINQSFCAPSATFVEISVIRWLRELVSYKNNRHVDNVWGVGGIITTGGTMSNTVGMLLARENKINCMQSGIKKLEKCHVLIPKGIAHYSIKSGLMWIGCGNQIVEVETENFRYNLDDLRKKMTQYKGKIMCVVAYAGDSRTMTIEHFGKVVRIVRSIDPSVWLHADACHGFSLGASDKLRYKLKGIEQFDSITLDPHKVFAVPYSISALLIKNPRKMKLVTSTSDLIMQEKFAFGQITPFLGSKAWDSLKLWFLIKNLGRRGLGKMVDKRYDFAQYLMQKLRKDKDFIVLNDVDFNSVIFMYKKNNFKNVDILNKINKEIYKQMAFEGKYYLHQFSIQDPGKIKRGALLYPLRYMCGNPNNTKKDIDGMVEYVRSLGAIYEKK